MLVNRAKLDPHAFFRRLPLAPHQMRDRVTRREDVIVLCHLGVARLDAAEWSLIIDGLVDRPRTLRLADLLARPKAEVTSVHQCAGSPLQPAEPTQRVSNVTWGGARLAELLAECGPSADARFVWATGADHGAFGGVAIDAYVKDVPIERVPADVLIAYEMNGAPLAPEHGWPARVVVPGFYGTNSVKWLTRLTLARARATGPFTTRWYNDPVPDGKVPGAAKPVWAIAPQSVIVAPAPDARLDLGRATEIWGWAWADGGVQSVVITLDGGAAWGSATLEPPAGRAWQRFVMSWTPTQRGSARFAARATASSGEVQADSGRRNAIHSVSVHVV
jgi:DMSO/TMAO reductase YedYZ molybdopterin-dependent catalytic subunit